MKYKSIGSQNHSHFTLELRPTSKCNYNCYYCTDLHINSNPINKFKADDIIKLIESIKRNLNLPIHIYICGGEPTLYKDLDDLIIQIGKYLSGPDYITIQTNLSKPLKWLSKFTKKLISLPISIKVNCSYHNTQVADIYNYINKCLYLKHVNMLGIISIAYNQRKDVDDNYDKFIKVVGKDYCEVVPLINASVDQDPHKGNNSDSDIDILNAREKDKSHYGHFFRPTIPCTTSTGETKAVTRNHLWLTRGNNFHGSKCSVSKYKMYIDWDGRCFSCFNYQFADVPPIFHISMTGKFDDYFSNIKCINCPFTTCFFDIEYEKVSQDIEVPVLLIDRKYNTNELRSAY